MIVIPRTSASARHARGTAPEPRTCFTDGRPEAVADAAPKPGVGAYFLIVNQFEIVLCSISVVVSFC